MSSNIKLKIAGMHCASCAMNIDFDLEDADGIQSSQTSYAKQVCEVVYDTGKINLEKIVEIIKTSGFGAEPEG